jgi:P4 family phage/plasmid primase-like protien
MTQQIIPKNIRHLKFLSLKGKTKDAFQKGWPQNPELHLTAEKAEERIAKGDNYGVILGPLTGVGAIDCDHKVYIDAVTENFPETFSVQSSSDSKRHFYYIIKNFPKNKTKISLIDPDNRTDASLQGGDIRNGNFYLVGPGSIHPISKKPYQVITDIPIAEIDFNDISDLLSDYFKSNLNATLPQQSRKSSPLPITTVLKHYNVSLPYVSGNEISGPHPIHGSLSSGKNFGVNIENNVWCCRRCQSGGSIVHLVAMLEGLVECSALADIISDSVREQAIEIIKEKFDIELYYEIKLPLNDSYNANIFAKQHKDHIKFCSYFGGWLIYNGQIWDNDRINNVSVLANETYLSLIKETPAWVPVKLDPPDEDEVIQKIKESAVKAWKAHLKESGSSYHLAQMVNLSTKDLSIVPEDFDKVVNKICIKNGVFDLESFSLLPFSPDLLFTKQANFSYDPSATCPNWDRFLKIVFLNDEEMIRYVQRVIGYSLTADISRQIFLIMKGDGANGKSTFLETILHGFGSYGAKLSSQSIIRKKEDSIPNDWAALTNKRFVVVSELEQSRELDTGIVKQFTSKSPMRVRFLHKEYFDMTPTFKVFLETNPLPRIKGQDDGIWRRIKKIDFGHRFEESDKIINYKEEVLFKELPGIFNWALAGLKDLNENGEREPDSVKVSIEDYKRDENPLADFIDECCERDIEVYTLASDMWDYYKSYMASKGEAQYGVGKHTFPDMMGGLGVKRIHNQSRKILHREQKLYAGIKCTKELLPKNSWESKISPPPCYPITNSLNWED